MARRKKAENPEEKESERTEEVEEGKSEKGEEKKTKRREKEEIAFEKETKETEEKKGSEKKEKHEKKEERLYSEEINRRIENSQPEINIGLVGHVDHGKTTLTERFSGKWTDTHSEEIKRGITIRLGYADAIFYKCTACPSPAYTTKKICPKCNAPAVAFRKVSFVDAPGHESLMATMLCGANIMDGALLLVAGNESCPQPQTKEHLMALEIVDVKKVIVVHNKIDMVSREQAMKNFQQIKSVLKGTKYEDAPIVPISAKHNVNIDALIEVIEKIIVTPERDPDKNPMMFVARSFDVNKPGTLPKNISGGVLGGAIKQGKLKKGDEIEIRPGREVEEKNQKIWVPIFSKIQSLITGGINVDEAGPGGSIGVQTLLDPSVVKSDNLVGAVVGHKGKLPKVLYDFILEPHLLDRVVGAKEESAVEPLKLGESLMLNVNSAATVGIVVELGKNQVRCKLKLPVCADVGSRVTISRRIGTRFRLIGYGMIKE